MARYVPILITAAALVYGGTVDLKRREIPNAVPIILIAIGVIFGISILRSIMGLVVPALLLFTAAKITKSEIPGGDFKLLCSLGFACGLWELAIFIFISGIGAAAYSLIRHLPLKRHIPLCTYIAPTYIIVQIISLILQGGRL